MIIYSGNKAEFMNEVEEDTIAYRIRDSILQKMHRKTGDAEFKSWVNSLEYMYKVLNDDEIPKDSGVAIEFNLPNTAKREISHTGRLLLELAQGRACRHKYP